jgi:hypothetical protein
MFLSKCILGALVVLTSCSFFTNETSLYGKYVPVNYKVTFDTLVLKQNQIYSRKIYDKDKKIVFSTTGKWKLVNGTKIVFENFFENFDRDLNRFPELLSDTLGGVEVVIETGLNNNSFCFGYFPGENCYNKID